MDSLPNELTTIVCEYLDLSGLINLYLFNPIIYNKTMNQSFIKNLYKRYNCEILVKSESVLTLLNDLVHIIDVKNKIKSIYHFLKQKVYGYTKRESIITFLIDKPIFISVFGEELSNRYYNNLINETIIQQQISQMFYRSSFWYTFVTESKSRYGIRISNNIKDVIFNLLYYRVDIKLEEA